MLNQQHLLAFVNQLCHSEYSAYNSVYVWLMLRTNHGYAMRKGPKDPEEMARTPNCLIG